jgi:hypothetical protein
MKATYYLISTINSEECGWSILAEGSKLELAKVEPNEFKGNDIYANTWRKNSKIVSKTIAERKYHICIDAYYDALYEENQMNLEELANLYDLS